MNKEEILQKAQKEKNDEFIQQVEKDTKYYLMTAIEWIIDLTWLYFLIGQPNAEMVFVGKTMLIQEFLFFFVAVIESFGGFFKYSLTKKKWQLFWGILFLFMVVFDLIYLITL